MNVSAAIRSGTIQLTALFLVASGLLLVLGLAGVSSSLPVAAFLLLLAVGLALTRPEEGAVGRVRNVDLDSLLRYLWVAPALAAVPLLFELGATPEEVVALGGILGLIGMANYFLRPAYLLVYGVLRSLRGGSGGRVNGQ